LERELGEHGAPTLHARLAAVDAEAAAAILPTNGRRIVRALEVIELTGGPFLARMPGFESVYDTVSIGLDRDDLDERIAARVHRMMAMGLLDEVRALLPLGLRASPTAGKALGYAQLLGCLDDEGVVRSDIAPAVDATIQATKRFVRRQRAWFRRDPRVAWFDARAPDLAGRVVTTLQFTGH
jgi:tRNA dimethylallyltransferase